MEFIMPLDNMKSFEAAASFIQKWYAKDGPHNATDFATDFPAVVERCLCVRRTLLNLRKANNFSLETEFDDKNKPKL